MTTDRPYHPMPPGVWVVHHRDYEPAVFCSYDGQKAEELAESLGDDFRASYYYEASDYDREG